MNCGRCRFYDPDYKGLPDCSLYYIFVSNIKTCRAWRPRKYQEKHFQDYNFLSWGNDCWENSFLSKEDIIIAQENINYDHLEQIKKFRYVKDF